MAQAEAGKGGISGEHDVTEPSGAISCIVDVLPVGLKGWCAGRVAAVQVKVQDLQDLLVHGGFKLPGKEGRSGYLLEGGKTGKVKMLQAQDPHQHCLKATP